MAPPQGLLDLHSLIQEKTLKIFLSEIRRPWPLDIWYVALARGSFPRLFKLSVWGPKWRLPGGHLLAHLSYAHDELWWSLFVRQSVNIFKRPLKPMSQFGSNFIWSLLRLGGNERLLKWLWSIDPDGRHAHIWWKPLKIFFFRTENAFWLNLCINHQGWEVYQNC